MCVSVRACCPGTSGCTASQWLNSWMSVGLFCQHFSNSSRPRTALDTSVLSTVSLLMRLYTAYDDLGAWHALSKIQHVFSIHKRNGVFRTSWLLRKTTNSICTSPVAHSLLLCMMWAYTAKAVECVPVCAHEDTHANCASP